MPSDTRHRFDGSRQCEEVRDLQASHRYRHAQSTLRFRRRTLPTYILQSFIYLSPLRDFVLASSSLISHFT
jgi:hypothetical protein